MSAHLLDGLLGPLEIAVNRALAASPEALEALAAERDALGLELRDLGWRFTLCPVPHGIALAPGDEKARAAVSTSLVGLARLAAGEDARTMGEALRLSGDAEYAQQFFDIFRDAGVDLKAELGSLLGPDLVQRAGSLARELLGGGRQALRSALFGTAGGGDELATGLAQWMEEVDELAVDMDRAEARVSRLETR